MTLAYADMKRIDFSPGVFFHADIIIRMLKHGTYDFSFMLTAASNDKVQTLVNAINTMIADAQQGKSVVCSDNPQDYADDLAAFEQQTAAWRALATKPPLSDEAYKDLSSPRTRSRAATSPPRRVTMRPVLRRSLPGIRAGTTWRCCTRSRMTILTPPSA